MSQTTTVRELRRQLQSLTHSVMGIEDEINDVSSQLGDLERRMFALNDQATAAGDVLAVERQLLWDVLDVFSAHGIGGEIRDKVIQAIWGDSDA